MRVQLYLLSFSGNSNGLSSQLKALGLDGLLGLSGKDLGLLDVAILR